MIHSVHSNAGLGCPPHSYTTNTNESINRVLKEKVLLTPKCLSWLKSNKKSTPKLSVVVHGEYEFCVRMTPEQRKVNTDKVDRNLVTLLWCSVCRNYQDKICSMKNYSSAWVTGTENQRTSNMLDHVACDQHKVAMSHLRTVQAKESSEPVTSYALIARALLMLDEPERERMRRNSMCAI